jgi:hypothetical protein
VDAALVDGSPSPTNVALIYEKAVLLESTGGEAEAATLYDAIIDGFLADRFVDDESMVHVAMAMWATNYVQDANEVFRFAVESDPRDPDTQVLWGDMLSAKYQRPEPLPRRPRRSTPSSRPTTSAACTRTRSTSRSRGWWATPS